MKYLEMFTGIAGFSKGIEQAYEDIQRTGAGQELCVEADAHSGLSASRESGQSPIVRNNASANGGGYGMPECVGFSEISKVACGVLKYRFPNVHNFGDASLIVPESLPDFDFLCGGFPCQAFSIAGKRQGFDDTRGTLFFEIARLLSHKRPRHFLLENVRGLVSHDSSKTLQRILGVLAQLGYRVECTVLNSKDHGVPQNRERIFFIGHLGAECSREILSFGQGDGDIDGSSGQRNDLAHTITNDDKARGSYDVAPTDTAYAVDANYHKGCNDIRKGRRTVDNGAERVTVGTLRTHKDGEGFREMSEEVSPSLNARARQDGSQQTVVAIPVLTPDRPVKGQNGRRMKEDGEASFTITAQDKHGVMIDMPISNAVTPDAYLTRGERKRDENGKAVLTSMFERRIRRLTPVECARLQGFDDDWASLGMFQNKQGEWHVREISDTGQYQCYGNAVTTNVIEAIISRMLEKGCLQ